MAKQANPAGFDRMRDQLWQRLSQETDPDCREVLELALISANPAWAPRVFEYFRTLPAPDSKNDQNIFAEPRADQVKGQVLVGSTIPGKHPVYLSLKSFGAYGHTLLAGRPGAGKSTLLNFISLQLVDHVPVMIYDVLGQAARILVPHVPTEKLGVVDFPSYRRNFLLGPPGTPQLQWIRSATDYLMEALDIEPVTMNVLLQMCDALISAGRIASVPALLAALEDDKCRTQSHKALKNRLLTLTLGGHKTFACERGFDLAKMFERSIIFDLKDAAARARKLIFFDHYHYLSKAGVLGKWSLRNVMVFHEAASFVSRSSASVSAAGESYFLKIVREARNYGIGFIFADQVPQFEHTVVKAAIGTRGIFCLEDIASVDPFRVSMGLSEEQRNTIMNLPNRVMLLRRPDIPHPFLVRIPELY